MQQLNKLSSDSWWLKHLMELANDDEQQLRELEE
uniref:Uncharacterized protein n=1 Tax=Ciona savignyi TaxID=51511 RepID=H2ZM99_CIOSA